MPSLPAVSYSRRSSEQRDNYSLSYQDKANQQCAERESLRVVESIAEDITGTIHLKDRAPSKAEIKRGRVARHGCDAWSLIVSKKVKAIIVYRIDRLSRADTADALILIRDILRHGCRIYISSTGKQITDPNDIATIIESWQSGREKDAIVEKLRDGRIAKAKTKWLGIGPAPYGYAKRGEGKTARLVIDKKEAAIVKRIFSQYATDAATMRSIAETLNKRGVPSPQGKLWRFSTVRWILKSTVYVGRIRYGGVESMDKSLVLVPLHEWRAVQDKMRSNQLNAARNTKGKYLMARHIFCDCGARMTPVTNRGRKPRYICMKRPNPMPTRCYESADAAQIDRLAADYIRWALTDEILAQGIAEKEKRDAETSQGAPNRIAVINTELERHRKRIDRLMVAFGDGDDAAKDAIEAARESIKTLEAEREKLTNAGQEQESRRLARESIAAHVRRLRSYLDNPSYELLTELVTICDVKARLLVDGNGRSVVFSSAVAPDLTARL